MEKLLQVSSDILPSCFQGMQLPTPRVLKSGHIQVYFATRMQGKSQIGYCILEFNSSTQKLELVDLFNETSLKSGSLGTYSQDGIHPSSVIEINGKIYMYTIGWIEGKSKPLFSSSIGIAVSIDGNSFVDMFNSPIMDRSEYDPTLVTSPNVITDPLGGYKMFYTSGTEWVTLKNGDFESRYHIKTANSVDGTTWKREGEIAINLWGTVTNVARPAFFSIDDNNFLLFSFQDSRKKKYQLGLAILENNSWTRKVISDYLGTFDEVNCAAYPAVCTFQGQNLLFINGVDRGRSGFSVYLF